MKIVHVITGLNGGGAQYFLYRLLPYLAAEHECEVICLSSVGPIGEKIRAIGIPVRALEMGRHPLALGAFLKLRRRLKEAKPDLVHTWMYHSDLLGGLAARSLGIRHVVWAIHSPDIDKRYIRFPTRIVARICAALSSRVPAAIVSCAHTAWKNHARFGFSNANVTVIPNGFDVSKFRPDAKAGQKIRDELGIPADAPLVGMVARFNEQKGHKDFCTIAKLLRGRMPDVRFLLAGRDVTPQNRTLTQWLEDAGLKSGISVIGPRDDVPDILNALDVLVSPSLGEAFPLIIGETMACGVPCVATDVGDTAWIVGDGGIVTPPGDEQAIVEGIIRILDLPVSQRRELGYRAHQHITREFDLGAIAIKYKALYEAVVSREPAPMTSVTAGA